ncbi:MAG: WYL domain-containing protein, partial [Lapillicoccus sp.]
DRSGAWIVDYYPTEGVVDLPDGGRRVTLRVSDPSWVRRLVWRMGGHITVVTPAALRDEVVAGAEQALAAYAVTETNGESGDGSGEAPR